MRQSRRLSLLAAVAFFVASSPAVLASDELIEKTGVGVGVTAGNVLFLPVKAISVGIGALSGALSYVMTGGDTEVSRQVWRDTTQGPYVITHEIARTAIGDRPEKDFATK